jgi:glycosyltransferase involved in cell wall biosynthesis
MSAGCIATHCDSRTYGHKLWRVARQAIAANAGKIPSGLRDVIYLSDFSRAILEPYYGPRTRWRKVSNGINVEKSPRIAAENNEHFLFLGRMSPEKGALLFAEAAAIAGVKARIVGDGDERASIARRWPQVEMPGWMAPADAIAQLTKARALVFPSLWYETQGLTVYEALARGVPVIVADGVAAAEAVTNNQNGLLFRGGDARDLAARIAALSDDARARAMSETAYARYWARPTTPEVHIDELIEAYRAILAEQEIA